MGKLILLGLLLALSVESMAQVKTIAVLGPTTRVLPYLHQNYGSTPPAVISSEKGQVILHLPKTTLMTLGDVTTKRENLPHVRQPIFIIGTDQRSMAWLAEYATQLRRLHAIGIVVNAQTNGLIGRLNKKYGLVLLPLSANAFAKKYHLKHYPVMISHDGIEQ